MARLVQEHMFGATPVRTGRETNKVDCSDGRVHNWYRFVLSFPPHLVRDYLRRFNLDHKSTVLDPFCGTGTTLVEARLNRVMSIGVEVNPIACLATKVKLDWRVNADEMKENSERVAGAALRSIRASGIDDSVLHSKPPAHCRLRTLPEEQMKLLIKNSISPVPLHKVLILREAMERHSESYLLDHYRIALAKALVCGIGNLRFGPEVGLGKVKADVPVVSTWLAEVRTMARDLASLSGSRHARTKVLCCDSRNLSSVIPPTTIDAVITSPPYPNEKDYTRTTRLESVVLGLISSNDELRGMKKDLIRSNTRGVYKGDDDDLLINGNERIEQITTEIERRRISLGKTSGFERLYPRVTKLYFGGMKRHLADLRTVLRPGAKLAYVVGDQASYLQVMIRTGEFLAEIATGLGYKVEAIELFRMRAATASKSELREEILILTWPG
ncbi:MAG: DNA methyltransferase [Candidatus Zixiibacteriota bacterium]